MELPPAASPSAPMFRRGPLTFADDGQSGAVNDEVQAGARADLNCKVALKQAQSRSTASCSISSAWVVSCRATYQEGLSRILHRFGVDEDQDLQEAAAPTPDRPAVPRRPGRAGHGPLKGSPSVAGFPTSEPQKSRGAGLSQPYGTTAKSEIRANRFPFGPSPCHPLRRWQSKRNASYLLMMVAHTARSSSTGRVGTGLLRGSSPTWPRRSSLSQRTRYPG